MMLLPIGHDQSLRRFPWLTTTLIVLCTLVQLRQTASAPGDAEVLALGQRRAYLESMLLLRYQAGGAASDDGAAPGADQLVQLAEQFRRSQGALSRTPAERQLLDDLREGRRGSDEDAALGEWRDLLERQAQIDRRDLVQRYGYRPAGGLSPNLVLSAFVHAGWLHLLGNILFLWLVGCNLEDRWGKPAMAALFLVGAAASALAYGALHRGSTVPLVGASGAIAAAMGAFLVCFHDATIKYWYLFFTPFPRTGTFEAQALFAFPAWFVVQVLQMQFEAHGLTEVAYSGHVAGFAFGALVAGALKLTGLERRHLLPAASRGVEWTEDEDFLAATDLLVAGRHADAMPLLRQVLTRQPGHAMAQLELCRAAIATSDVATLQAHLSQLMLKLQREGRAAEAQDLYRAGTEKLGALPLSERALVELGRMAASVGDDALATTAYETVIREHGATIQAPRALWEIAAVYERARRISPARASLEELVARFPMDGFAEQARRKLADLPRQTQPNAPVRLPVEAPVAAAPDPVAAPHVAPLAVAAEEPPPSAPPSQVWRDREKVIQLVEGDEPELELVRDEASEQR